jgi:YYY domain-containing protein
MGSDFWLVVRFWAVLFLIGSVAYPLTRKLFKGWWDNGYLFSKSFGLVLISYLVWLGASLHVFPFVNSSIYLSMAIIFGIGILFGVLKNNFQRIDGRGRIENNYGRLNLISAISIRLINKIKLDKIGILFLEELFFFLAFLFWSYVKGHEASIHGLEKFMDFGFAKSILNSTYFPPQDMWYAGSTINYYYFGHYIMALLSRLSFIDLRYVFNLTLASLFAFTFTMSFSIGYQLIYIYVKKLINVSQFDRINISDWKIVVWSLIGGFVTAYLVTLAGNMQTIYAYTKGYTGENVKPFWQLLWRIDELPNKLSEGMNTYWYANATRFIPYTIHEFPSYSFVVSDVHGHVMSLPFVLLAIAFLIQIFGRTRKNQEDNSIHWLEALFFGILIALLFMTNVLDAPIYMGLFLIMSACCLIPRIFHLKDWVVVHATNVAFAAFAGPAIIPFVLKFKSFVSGLAVNCPPRALADHKIGLFLFETVDKCQKSPFWMIWLLWGFFLFCGGWFIFSKLRINNSKLANLNQKYKIQDRVVGLFHQFSFQFSQTEFVLVIFFLYSLGLIIFPEFFYFKDIYPQHFRSNTMFKLGYQAFIMFSIVAGYTIVVTIISLADKYVNLKTELLQIKKLYKIIFLVLVIPQLFLVCIYPTFSIKSYFGLLGNYKSLDGLAWFQNQYPDDYEAILWLDGTLDSCRLSYRICDPPVIVEADSDSYTDYARFSAYTGTPTVIGWGVHEWLWRGTYDIVAPRREDVIKIYESDDIGMTQKILAKYNVSYIIIGTLEREKYKNLNEVKIAKIATIVYSFGNTQIYRVNNMSTSGI